MLETGRSNHHFRLVSKYSVAEMGRGSIHEYEYVGQTVNCYVLCTIFRISLKIYTETDQRWCPCGLLSCSPICPVTLCNPIGHDFTIRHLEVPSFLLHKSFYGAFLHHIVSVTKKGYKGNIMELKSLYYKQFEMDKKLFLSASCQHCNDPTWARLKSPRHHVPSQGYARINALHQTHHMMADVDFSEAVHTFIDYFSWWYPLLFVCCPVSTVK